MIVLAIILLAPLLLSRLKIPNIIGLIIAGVAVGPYGFNLLARDMSFEIFGQVGILYLMFLAGLEIDMYHLRKNINRGLLLGLYTFVIPLAAGVLAGHWLIGLGWDGAWLVAAIMAAHTLIGYPLVSRFGLTRRPAVIIAVAATIITVLGALVVLADVVDTAHSGHFTPWATLRLGGWLVVFCAAVGYIYPRLTRWFLKTHIDGIVQFIYILAMVFLAAWGATLFGIEGVFGAFYAGLTLNRYIPRRSALMGRIEFVGNAIFIPYFLIGVGMLIDVRVVFAGWSTLYVATVLSGVAMGAKWLAAWVAQKSFGMTAVDRSVMYQLTNAHTAVALAVVMTGYSLGLFDHSMLNGTVLMILITCTVASFGTARAASRLARCDNDTGTATLPAPTSHTLISLATPLSAPSLIGLATLMRRQDNIDSKLYALHVRSDNSASSRAIGRNSLDVAREVAASIDTPIVALERFDLNIVTGVLNTVAERDISMILLGLHRRGGIADTFYGSIISKFVGATHRMVVISRTLIPLNTVRRVHIFVPERAEYETGFTRWLDAVCTLTGQIGCRITFTCFESSRPAILALVARGKYGIRYAFRIINSADDYVLMAKDAAEDDLVIFVTARPTSVSYTSELDEMTGFMSHYFAHTNLLVIYPEQTGEHTDIPTMADTMTPDITSTPSRLWLRLQQLLRRK